MKTHYSKKFLEEIKINTFYLMALALLSTELGGAVLGYVLLSVLFFISTINTYSRHKLDIKDTITRNKCESIITHLESLDDSQMDKLSDRARVVMRAASLVHASARNQVLEQLLQLLQHLQLSNTSRKLDKKVMDCMNDMVDNTNAMKLAA